MSTAALNTELAEEMFSSAATILSHLTSKETKAGATTVAESDAALRLDEGWVVSLAEIPSGNLSFAIRFQDKALMSLVSMMMGGGEVAAGDTSLAGEISSQVASTMAEALGTRLHLSPNGITAVLCDDAKKLPIPPFVSFTACLLVGEDVNLDMRIDLDTAAVAKTGLLSTPPEATVTAGAPEEKTASQVEKETAKGPQRKAPQAAAFTQMSPNVHAGGAQGSLDLVHNVPMNIRALLGGTSLSLREIMTMQPGSVFELHHASAEPVDLFVNNVLFARGEVLVVEDKYAVKISEIAPGSSLAR